MNMCPGTAQLFPRQAIAHLRVIFLENCSSCWRASLSSSLSLSLPPPPFTVRQLKCFFWGGKCVFFSEMLDELQTTLPRSHLVYHSPGRARASRNVSVCGDFPLADTVLHGYIWIIEEAVNQRWMTDALQVIVHLYFTAALLGDAFSAVTPCGPHVIKSRNGENSKWLWPRLR